MTGRLTFILLATLLTLPCNAWQTATDQTAQDSLQTADLQNNNVKSFEMIWNTIRESHWDQDLVGESWDRHRLELLPKIKAAATTGEARKIMTELIDRLEQSHFGIIPQDSYEVMGDEIGGGNCDVGMTLRIVEGDLVVTEVRPGSSAANQGVVPGWTIDRIRDRDSSKLIEKFVKAAHGPMRAETIAGLASARMTSGNRGEKLNVEFRDSTGQPQQLELTYEDMPGKIAKLGNLPPMRVTDETKTLDNNIGYYRFNAFLDPVRIMPAYRKAMRDKSHSRGIIIDLRGNIGGLAAMTMGMASEFVSKPSQLGTMTMKGNSLKFIANPRPKPITVPIAVIVDECSISSAEIFAGGLKDLGLAQIIGCRTAGLALPSVVVKLPNGDGFQYAIADYHSANGETLETNGVVPDNKIELNKRDLINYRDPALKAAIEWIEQKNNGQISS